MLKEAILQNENDIDVIRDMLFLITLNPSILARIDFEETKIQGLGRN